jgi:hypothetical protein
MNVIKEVNKKKFGEKILKTEDILYRFCVLTKGLVKNLMS